MKKLFKTLLAAIIAAGIFTALCSCGDNGQKLSIDKKYILSGYVNTQTDNTVSIIFYKDGTGKYTKYSKHESMIDQDLTYTYDYAISFKYIVIEYVIICTYDGVEYGPDDTENRSLSNWEFKAAYSEKVLMNTAGDIYYCETYIPEIPNFNEGNN